MNIKLLAVAAVILIAVSPYAAFAQGEEGLDYGYGTVVSVDASGNRIVVNEYDWESDTETNVTYSLDPDVEIENVDSISEIQPGSEVDIDYKMEGSKRIAKIISVYEQELLEIE